VFRLYFINIFAREHEISVLHVVNVSWFMCIVRVFWKNHSWNHTV